MNHQGHEIPLDMPLLSARETAARLGVKLDTLYAYVSRGRLRSVARPGSRERGYRAEDVERFRLTRQRGERPETLSPAIDSAISLIDGGRFYYRGVDAIRLATHASLEETAALLWDGAAIDAAASDEPMADPPPAAGGLIERCQICLALLAARDLAALDLTPAGVRRSGWRILAALVGCVGGCSGEGAALPEQPVHDRLAAAWRLDASGADIVRRCLVLLADHELNASTFVARCVASTGATPYAVVIAALAALSGRRHGGAAARAEALFHEIGDDDPLTVMAARLARDEPLPGLGQPLYPGGDPRALAIIEALHAARPEAGARAAAAAVAALQLTGEYPNVDFALAAAATGLGLPPGSALSLFIVARSAGWVAHAIEQYHAALLIRPRARYIGPSPGGRAPADPQTR